jgi:hypothetical protein
VVTGRAIKKILYSDGAYRDLGHMARLVAFWRKVKSSSSIQTWYPTRELRPLPSSRALVLARRCCHHSKPELCHSNRSGR